MEQQRQFSDGSGQQPQQQYGPVQGSFSGMSSQMLGLQNPSAQNVRLITGSSSRSMNSHFLRQQTPYDQNVGSIQGSLTSIISSPMSNLPLPPSYQSLGSMLGSSGGITSHMLGPQSPTLLRHSMGQKSSQLMPTQIHSQPLLNFTRSSSVPAVHYPHMIPTQIHQPLLNSIGISSAPAVQEVQPKPTQIYSSPLLSSTGASAYAVEQTQLIPNQIHQPLPNSTGSLSAPPPIVQQAQLIPAPIYSRQLLDPNGSSSALAVQQTQLPAQIHHQPLFNPIGSSRQLPTQIHHQPLYNSIGSSSVPAVQQTQLKPNQIRPRALLNAIATAVQQTQLTPTQITTAVQQTPLTATQVRPKSLFNSTGSSSAGAVQRTQLISAQIDPQLPTRIHPKSLFNYIGNSSVAAVHQTQPIPVQIDPQPLPTHIHPQPLLISTESSSAPAVQRTHLIPTDQIHPRPPTAIHSQPLFNSTGGSSSAAVQQTQFLPAQIDPQPLPTQIHLQPLFNSPENSSALEVQQSQLIPAQIHPRPLPTQGHPQPPLFNCSGSLSAVAVQQTQLTPTQIHPKSLLDSTVSSTATALQQIQSESNKRGLMLLPQLSDIPVISQNRQEPVNKKQRYQEISELAFSPSVSEHTALQQRLQHDPMDIQPTETNHGSGYILGMCTQRLVEYTLKMQERPQDNNIEFWKNFVSEFYAKDAKMRWCVSSYGKKVNGVSEQEAWNCGLCQIKPGHGYEVCADVMPRLCKTMYDTGAVKERYRLEQPSEYQTASGLYVLQSSKVTHETVYPHRRVVRHGFLCIVFTPELKICTWEFCGQSHDEFVPRADSSLQISDHSETAKKYEDAKNKSNLPVGEQQSSLRTGSSSSISQTNKTQKISDFGCEGQYARGLQISQVVSHMKDLIAYTRRTGAAPQESMALFNATFNMLDANKNSVQQLQELLEHPQPQPMAENVMIDENSWDRNQMNAQYFPGHEATTSLAHLSGPPDLSASTAEPSLSFAMPPSATIISPMEIGGQQQGEMSPAASVAAKLNIDSDISSMPETSNDMHQLGSPNSVAKTFGESFDYLTAGGPDGMQIAGNADDNVINGNEAEMVTDGSNSGGEDAIVDNTNVAIPDDDFDQLLLFIESQSAFVDVTDDL